MSSFHHVDHLQQFDTFKRMHVFVSTILIVVAVPRCAAVVLFPSNNVLAGAEGVWVNTVKCV